MKLLFEHILPKLLLSGLLDLWVLNLGIELGQILIGVVSFKHFTAKLKSELIPSIIIWQLIFLVYLIFPLFLHHCRLARFHENQLFGLDFGGLRNFRPLECRLRPSNLFTLFLTLTLKHLFFLYRAKILINSNWLLSNLGSLPTRLRPLPWFFFNFT